MVSVSFSLRWLTGLSTVANWNYRQASYRIHTIWSWKNRPKTSGYCHKSGFPSYDIC